MQEVLVKPIKYRFNSYVTVTIDTYIKIIHTSIIDAHQTGNSKILTYPCKEKYIRNTLYLWHKINKHTFWMSALSFLLSLSVCLSMFCTCSCNLQSFFFFPSIHSICFTCQMLWVNGEGCIWGMHTLTSIEWN